MTLTASGICCGGTDVGALAELVREMKAAHGRCRVVEVGTWLGDTALALLAAGAEIVHCVDTWEGTEDPNDACHQMRQYGHAAIYREFRKRVGDKLHNGIEPHVGKSLDTARGWPYPVELIFLDADHREPAVLADIAAWTPHVVKGGVLCGHDVYWESVRRAVDATGAWEKVGEQVWVRRL